MTTCYYNPEQQQQEDRTKPQPTRSSIPKSIFTNRGGGHASWLMGNKPLSPPLAKMDTQVPTPSISTPHRPSWHSLWSATTSWQPETQQTSPIDLDFLDSPIKDSSTSATDSRTGEYDYFDINRSTSFIASPILRRSSYVEKKSIWDLNYPSSTFFPPAPPSISSDTNAYSRDAVERRHSIAVVTQQRPITPPPQQQQIQQLIQQVQQQQKIDELFSPTATMIDVSTLGKGMLATQLAKHTTFYQVQFKAKYRTEFYYNNDAKIEVNDQVMVEADRGYDIGTVTAVIENTKEQRKRHKLNSDYHLKRLFRKASSEELLMYELKRQDEEKALVICQHKIKQKKLNMEVVGAEYQWDRRKLTFHFKANERIDFRELVRELFKIYKTRIWMCASSLED